MTGADAPDRYRIASTDDLADGDRIIAEVDGMEIAVFNVDGEFYALANYCVHQSGPACEGVLSGALTAEFDGDDWEYEYGRENGVVACPWHGWEFDVETGNHLAPTDHSIPTFDVVVENGTIYVER